MIAWWGPILHEYYAGTEGNGFTAINSEQWLEHRGSVGRALLGEVRIVDEETGSVQPPRATGVIYFANGPGFEYHNDPEKTRAARNPHGWSTLGDIGYLDEDGFLYLTDRKANMIISGGVNIYPQEAENVLITHPKVVDVAVFGVPNADFGEEVKAVVELADMRDASPELERELIAHCRAQLSPIKCPRSVDFEAELPRHATGKLYKRLLKDRYWAGLEASHRLKRARSRGRDPKRSRSCDVMESRVLLPGAQLRRAPARTRAVASRANGSMPENAGSRDGRRVDRQRHELLRATTLWIDHDDARLCSFRCHRRLEQQLADDAQAARRNAVEPDFRIRPQRRTEQFDPRVRRRVSGLDPAERRLAAETDVVTKVTDKIVIRVELVGVRDQRTIVDCVDDPVSVAVAIEQRDQCERYGRRDDDLPAPPFDHESQNHGSPARSRAKAR